METLSVDQLVGQTLGNYRVERLLGRGRLNAVYLARHLSSQRTDALTVYILPDHFSPEGRQRFMTRFRKEADAIIALDHPNILPVYAYGEHGGYPYLVTPYRMNGSLSDMLKKQGRFEPTDVQGVLEQLVAGLDYAHRKGFIHGTLKPSNIVFSDDQSMQVAGFGLMHILQIRGVEATNQPYSHLLSIADTFLPAPEYVAPEIVEGQAVDQRSDIYSLGCILFEMLSGQPPFTGINPIEIARQHVTQAVPLLRSQRPDIPIALASVINQALEREPTRRFQHVTELGEAFSQVLPGAASRALPLVRSVKAQEASKEVFSTNAWQLQPPIVTSQLPVLKKAPGGAPARVQAPATLVTPESWKVPSAAARKQATGKSANVPEVPAAKPAVPRGSPSAFVAPVALPFNVPEDELTLLKPLNAAPQAPVASPAFNSIPGVGEDSADLAEAYSWWSQPGEALPPPPAPEASQLVRSQQAQEPLRLPAPGMADWTMDGLVPGQMGMGSSPARRSRGFSRRQVIALVAAGGVVAAGAAVAVALGPLHLSTTPATPPQNANNGAMSQQTNTTGKTQTGNTNTQSQAKTTTNANTQGQTKTTTNTQPQKTTAGAGHTGTMVGSSKQQLNTAVVFKNPADNNNSLLIHLPNGSFVAYESACTHQGVTVKYHPDTKMLICPLHGSIFDPAIKGQVLQGPATQALPQVTIHVNGDGTITV